MRIADAAGHRWPVTGRTCSICSWPTLDEDPHPLCIPVPATTTNSVDPDADEQNTDNQENQ